MKKTILVVDDSKTALMMTQMVLARGSYRVITAGDGEEAVRKAVAERPDLIILDVVMPRADGFAALARLREHESTRGTPVIMLTTRGEEAHVERAMAIGCTDYMTKPVDSVELAEKVRGHLGE